MTGIATAGGVTVAVVEHTVAVLVRNNRVSVQVSKRQPLFTKVLSPRNKTELFVSGWFRYGIYN